MSVAPPFTKRDRRQLCTQYGYGHRPKNNWGSGDLPGPYAEGDIIEVHEGAKALGRLDCGPGFFVVCAAFSIDSGDAWYMRLRSTARDTSDRLHVAYAGRCDWDEEDCVDWLEGCSLIDTADPDGLAKRTALLESGWAYERPPHCPTCGQELR